MEYEHSIQIETQRLILRPVSLNTYHIIFNDFSNENAQAFLGFSKSNFLKEKERYMKGFFGENKSLLYFLLFHKQTDKNIGWSGFHTWNLNQNYAEIGYEIYSEKYKRKGLMSEAIGEVINYGFQKMNLRRIKAFIKPLNYASINFIKAHHFSEEQKQFRNKNKPNEPLLFSLYKNEQFY